MKKKTLIFSLIITSLLGCNTKNDDSITNNKESSYENSNSTIEVDSNLAINYDFGDPSTWKGEDIQVKDLGDMLLDAYQYDEMYDWGQSIMYDSKDELYKMWWCRQSGYDTIWYAESKDLKHWNNAKKIMIVEKDTTWIKMHVGKPSVVKINDEYRMYFEAPATLEGYKEFDNNVFMATSKDGINFEIYSKNNEAYPVIKMSDEEMKESLQHSKNNASGYGYYGIGQPSVCYVNNTYYLYCTHSLKYGDRMYLYTSSDGINFDEGREVFTRAGCGVKYNTNTNKFMMAYEYTINNISRVYFMDSTDGVNFTYKSLSEASNNKNIVSRGSGLVHGYPDFVGNELGLITNDTIYCAYMEGKMSDAGVDWRQYSNTWDIHLSMFELPYCSNKTMVLPNGYVNNNETITPYNDKHTPYEDKLVGIKKGNDSIVIDGIKDDIYNEATTLLVDRQAFNDRAIPSSLNGIIYMNYTDKNLYFYIDVFDNTNNNDDKVCIIFNENKENNDKDKVIYITENKGDFLITNGNNEAINNVEVFYKKQDYGYSIEIKIPWVNKKEIKKYDSFGFDCFIYNESNNKNYKSIVAFNDYSISYKLNKIGEIYFL